MASNTIIRKIAEGGVFQPPGAEADAREPAERLSRRFRGSQVDDSPAGTRQRAQTIAEGGTVWEDQGVSEPLSVVWGFWGTSCKSMEKNVVRPSGLEPPTFCSGAKRPESLLSNYHRIRSIDVQRSSRENGMTLCLTKCLSDFQEPFLRERRYLKNVTPKTITW